MMLQSTPLDIAKITQNNWRQGASLLIDPTKEVYITTQYDNPQLRLKDGIYIVLSQDCDIINSCLVKEPVVEIIQANRIPHYNKEVSSGKNPRLLHLILEEKGSFLEFIPYEKYFISRRYLESISASNILIDGPQLRVLTRWIVKRIVRSAFPGAFNDRLHAKDIKKIKQILEKEAKDSLGLFIRLASEKDLSDDQPYKVLVKMLVSKAVYDDRLTLLSIEKGFDQIISALDQIEGVEVIEGSQLQSLDDISVHHYQELKQWDFDYISFSNNYMGEVIGEEFI